MQPPASPRGLLLVKPHCLTPKASPITGAGSLAGQARFPGTLQFDMPPSELLIYTEATRTRGPNPNTLSHRDQCVENLPLMVNNVFRRKLSALYSISGFARKQCLCSSENVNKQNPSKLLQWDRWVRRPEQREPDSCELGGEGEGEGDNWHPKNLGLCSVWVHYITVVSLDLSFLPPPP